MSQPRVRGRPRVTVDGVRVTLRLPMAEAAAVDRAAAEACVSRPTYLRRVLTAAIMGRPTAPAPVAVVPYPRGVRLHGRRCDVSLERAVVDRARAALAEGQPLAEYLRCLLPPAGGGRG